MFNCPKCGSQHTQSFEAVHANGTVGFNGGTLATAAALRLSPPLRKSPFESLMFGGFFGVALSLIGYGIGCGISGTGNSGEMPLLTSLGLMVGFPLGVLPGIVFALRAVAYNSRQWPRDYADWQAMWYCNRCTHTFRPANLSVAA